MDFCYCYFVFCLVGFSYLVLFFETRSHYVALAGLAWSSLCRRGWPGTHRDLPASSCGLLYSTSPAFLRGEAYKAAGCRSVRTAAGHPGPWNHLS